MQKRLKQSFMAVLCVMASVLPSFALNVGEIGTDGKGNAFLVVMDTEQGVFAKKIRLGAISRQDHIFDSEVDGQMVAVTVPNHNPFVGRRSRVKNGLQRAALVRVRETKCLTEKLVVKVVLRSEDQVVPTNPNANNKLKQCVEAIYDDLDL